ncbi:TetR/AcrR family transcriptional regulator [Marinomonas sp. A79]|uniref:TetR/AcrR family transcriptional regulator n=1 Tax=Marinomonas vulgaris TaxID=2823372 RepID=A0ABS5HC36_9GAMM|nr:TetR/AcrR family transcriptional regulator [Marinomonas vulgaris]MBR7889228.1 TetR/AcrR family transcriptional regulator [Marinomonas vulgaris]
MSKKPKFEREQVIANATNLYWEKGYHGTSMRNLQDAIDMRPGSIYAEFGNKDGVFKASLEFYAQAAIAQLNKIKADGLSPLEALKAFVKHAVVDSQHNAPSSVCMLAKTIAELTEEHEELLTVAKQALKSVEHQFALLIEQAQEAQAVSSQKSASELARFLQIQITGLRTYAKTSDEPLPLAQMIDDLFEHYPFQ